MVLIVRLVWLFIDIKVTIVIFLIHETSLKAFDDYTDCKWCEVYNPEINLNSIIA